MKIADAFQDKKTPAPQQRSGGTRGDGLPTPIVSEAPEEVKGPVALDELLRLAEQGWHFVPVIEGRKNSWLTGWDERATNDPATLQEWHRAHPKSNWGFVPGRSGHIVLDCDTKKAAKPSDLNLPPTLTAKTPSGGFHFYFKLPENMDPPGNGRGRLPQGWDVRSGKGYVLIPGCTVEPDENYAGGEYDWESAAEDIAELPLEIVRALQDERKPVKEAEEYRQADVLRALEALQRLKPERADDYDSWVKVGMALRGLPDDQGYQMWVAWSKTSGKFRPDECYSKWRSWEERPPEPVTLASLFYMADQDTPAAQKFEASRNPTPSEVMSVLHRLGYTFEMDMTDDTLMVCGMRMSDALNADICTRLREFGYKGSDWIRDAMLAEGYRRPYHPIADTLKGLEWDGQPHIKNLCAYFEDKHDVFDVWLTRWLIGSVHRVLGSPGERHRTLVLDGPQEIGKSYFVGWLGSMLPNHHHEGAINPADKDDRLRLATVFTWEVPEFGSTTRFADRDSLKHFLTRRRVRERKPFGRFDIDKPATANFVATVNMETEGLLNDPTGNTRYMCATLTRIDWAYSKAIDIRQVWAEAVARHAQGEEYDPTKDESTLARQVNEDFELTDPLADAILESFELAPDDPTAFATTFDVLNSLRRAGHINSTGRPEQMRVAGILSRLGCEAGRGAGGGGRGYKGLRRRAQAWK